MVPVKADAKASKKDDKPAGKPVDPSKFETYFDFRNTVNYVKPHQTLAINRGESLKVLKVTVEVPDSLRHDLYRFTLDEFLSEGPMSQERVRLFDAAFDEAFTKKCKLKKTLLLFCLQAYENPCCRNYSHLNKIMLGLTVNK